MGGGSGQMSKMTDRERFRATMHFRKADRLPFCEWFGYDYETVLNWFKQGMPLSSITFQRDGFAGGRWGPRPDLRGSFFGLDAIGDRTGEVFMIDAGPIPRYVSTTISSDEMHKVFVSPDGTTQKVALNKPVYTFPEVLDWPVKTIDDWIAIKDRFDSNDPRRYPLDWSDKLIEYYKTTDHPIGLMVCGFFYVARQLMGTINLLTSFYRNPELVRSIIDFWADFLVESNKEAVESLKTEGLDYVGIWEDFAYKHGPHLSPKIFREFMLPNYKKLTEFLKRNGIDLIFIDTDGNPTALIPLLLEAGVNGLYPLEVAAGMDARVLRNEYRDNLLLIGNLDKRVLLRSKDEIKKEVESKVPLLAEKGGYIPSLDHTVPPDVPYENYLYYLDVLKKCL
jgi:uroporphyrinogen-III decarboxylase